MVEVGRDLWRSSCPKMLDQSSPPTAGCPEPCPNNFCVCPRRRLHNLSGHTIPALGHPYTEKVCPDLYNFFGFP